VCDFELKFEFLEISSEMEMSISPAAASVTSGSKSNDQQDTNMLSEYEITR
jgi:hypothetical protein